MADRPHRKFIAVVIAAAVIVTTIGTAASAQERNRRVEGTIAALIGLAVIGAIIAKHGDDDDHVATAPHIKPKPEIRTRPLPQRAQRNVLPDRCLRHFQTDFGTARMFGKRCLEKHYRGVNRLPQACARRVHTDRGVRRGWGARCLRQEGYQVARR